MKTPEQERMLHDVLHDENYAAYRTELREAILAEVRRQRRSRRTKSVLALAACVPLALAVHWIIQQSQTPMTSPIRVSIVRSIPLKADQIVTTAAHRPNFAVVQSRNIEIGSVRFDVVRTITELPLGTLTDDQLLELFKDRPIALVDSGTGKRLFFLDEGQPEFVNP